MTPLRLPIAEPCPERFADMPGSGARRECERCRLSVHDLSQMTRREITSLLARHRGQRLCVRYDMRPDGTVRFRPAPRSLATLTLGVMLAACAGRTTPSDTTHPPSWASTCVDATGAAMACPGAPDPDLDALDPGPVPAAPEPLTAEATPAESAPAAPPPASEDDPGCPIRPTAAIDMAQAAEVEVSTTEMVGVLIAQPPDFVRRLMDTLALERHNELARQLR